MALDPGIFKAYDIRGLYGSQIDGDLAEQIGRAFARVLSKLAGKPTAELRVALGHDMRLTAPELHARYSAGLVAEGARVLDAGEVATEVVYYLIGSRDLDGGLICTASHNPKAYTGAKLIREGAMALSGDTGINDVRTLIESGLPEPPGGGTVEAVDWGEGFRAAARAFVDTTAIGGLKVVLDGGNGMAGPTVGPILEALPLELIPTYWIPDGNFPGHEPNPLLPENRELVIAAVRDSGADLGIAFDGDTDRIGAVDDQGTVLYGDQLMIIYGREILTRKPGSTFIGEVKCSQLMYDDLAARGGNPIMWKTGHSLIKAKMQETRAELAGEMSGHMFFADRYYGFDDAIYAACRLMEIVANSGQPLSAQLADLPKTVTTPEIRFDCPDDLKFAVVTQATAELRARHKILDVDGVRVLFPKGWGLVRASNTQPVLVMRFEAETEDLLREYRREVEEVVAGAVAANRNAEPVS